MRTTHWLFAAAFLVLVFSSFPILNAHPRFYWGEAGGLGTQPLFVLPLPVRLGRSGWGRSLHFLAGWVAVFTGIVYVSAGALSGHFRHRLIPTGADLTWPNLRRVLHEHFSRSRKELQCSYRYNVVQRVVYLFVVFLLFPITLLTGLAMSPALTSVMPWLVEGFGGHQSARTLHFIFSQLIVVFFFVHVAMVARAGFLSRTLGMIIANPPLQRSDALTPPSTSSVPEERSDV